MTTRRTARKQKTTALSDAKIIEWARRYHECSEAAKKAEAEKSEAKSVLVSQMKARGTKALERAGVRLNIVTPTTTKYSEDGMWVDMTPRERKEAFDMVLNLSELPPAERAELIAQIKKIMTRSQIKKCISHKLNLGRLDAAVQNGKVRAEVVADNSYVQESASYPSVSFTGG